MPDSTAELDRLLSDGFVEGLAEAPLDDVRARRAECQQVEVQLSYLRRLVQGRLDIVRADVRRRSEGGPAGPAPLIEKLPRILAGPARPPGPGRLPTGLEPEGNHRLLTADLDRIIEADRLARVGDLSDTEVASVAEELGALERSVSSRRRALHARLDAIQAEIVRRYRSGEVTVDSLFP